MNRINLATVLFALIVIEFLSASEFAQVPVSAPHAEDQANTLPLVVFRGQLFVQAKINGEAAGYFVVDTGSTTSLIDPKVASKLNLHPIAEKNVSTFEGAKKLDVCLLQQFDVGSVHLRETPVFVGASSEDIPIGTTLGVIGMDILGRQPFAIDFRNSQITFYDPKNFVPPATEAQALAPDVTTPRVRASVESHPGWFEIDTGYSDNLMLSQSFVELNRDIVAGKPLMRVGRDWSANPWYYLCQSQSVNLLGKKVEPFWINIDPSNRFGPRIAGLIGPTSFRDGVLTIDMHAHAAWLTKLDPETTEALVQRVRDKSKHDAGFPILEDIVMLDRADAAEQVLKQGEPADNANFQNYTPLMFAAAHDETKIIDLLLSGGASPNHSSSYDGFSPLLLAARYGRTAAAKQLLNAGAEPDYVSKSGESALFIAAEGGYPDLVQVLLDHHATADLSLPTGETPLLAACSNGNTSAAEILLSHGADPNAAGRHATCLSSAADSTSVGCTRLLLEHHADPNQSAPEGTLPLMSAAARGVPDSTECVRLLLDAGADVTIRTRPDRGQLVGKTAFDIAVERGAMQSIRLLYAAQSKRPASMPTTAP
jgi:ankyrin repeat protein/predicted aspartyl protease